METPPLNEQSFCNGAWQWIVVEKLKKASLEQKLIHLVKKEKEEWSPVLYDAERNNKEITAEDRLEAAQWQSIASVECGWDIETRFGAICLFDDVMRKVRVGNRLLIPVAAATLCISAKLNDEDQDVKPAPHIIRTISTELSSTEINRMEILLLKKLEWNIQACLAPSFLQIMMALVTISAALYDKNDISCESLLTVFLEIEMRFLYLLMIRPESAGIRPSVLALCVVYFHLDWDNNPALKKESITWLKATLMVSEEELDKGLSFSHPIIGSYFYDSIPESSLKKLIQELPRESDFTNRVTLYDRLVMDLIYQSDVYINFQHKFHFLCPCAPKTSSKCLTTTVIPKHKKRNTGQKSCQPRFLTNKIRSGNRLGGRWKKRKNHSRRQGNNKENMTEKMGC